jgi:hypothetical protein
MAAPGFKIGTRVNHKSGWLDFNLVASDLVNFELLNDSWVPAGQRDLVVEWSRSSFEFSVLPTSLPTALCRFTVLGTVFLFNFQRDRVVWSEAVCST